MSPKQQRFAEEYVIDCNATQAAIRAGYSPKYAKEKGYFLLQLQQIQEIITEKRKIVSEKIEVDIFWVAKRLKDISDRCMQATPVMVKQGKLLVQKEDEKGNGVWEFDSSGANRATELIGKHLGFFTEDNKKEVTVKVPFCLQQTVEGFLNEGNEETKTGV